MQGWVEYPMVKRKIIRIDQPLCTGCGICTHTCPVTGADGSKAINILPLQAVEKAVG